MGRDIQEKRLIVVAFLLKPHDCFITSRPHTYFAGVIRREAACEPRDIIANRLDPWHGVHFHPYAFASLEVLSNTHEALDLRVGYRVTPRHTITVEARFDCPDPRTIVMTITGGEGVGSVVETHATPIFLAPNPRTAIIEATLATSDRPGFASAVRTFHLAFICHNRHGLSLLCHTLVCGLRPIRIKAKTCIKPRVFYAAV